jgi:DNA-binding transcriptional LysR family regulator
MIIDFRLKVFQTAAQRLSFTKAAHELYITQPAVTKHINELEKNIGRPLFNRHGNNISLTREGDLLLTFADKIIDLYHQMDEEINHIQQTVTGQLRIGASTTIAQYILPKILAKFKAAYSNTDITLLNDNTEHIESYVLDKKIDIGLIEGTARNPLLHYEPFIQDEIVLVTRTGNHKAKKAEIKSEQLKKLPLVIRETGSGTLDVIEKALAGNHIHRNDLHIEIALGSTGSVKNYLLHSDAFAFLSVHTVLEELAHNKLSVIEVADLDIRRTFRFVCLHGQHTDLISRFKKFCLMQYKI